MSTEDTSTAIAQHIGRAVRARRAAQALSLGDLARASGLSKTILARIERGAGNPSVDTLWRVSRALRVPLGDLLADGGEPAVHRIDHRSGDELHASSGMRAWLLDADGREHRSEVFELDLPAGADQRSEAHLPGTEELVVCISGRLRCGPLGDERDLGPGDAVRFTADVAHRYAALEDTGAICVMRYAAAAR